jgi:hypothetical protein
MLRVLLLLLQVLPAGDGGVATVGFQGVAGLQAVGEKDPFVKGLRTYLQVRRYAQLQLRGLQGLSYGSTSYTWWP